MSRVKITEYKAKKLILGDAYQGIALGASKQTLPRAGKFVVKVDQGIKQRFKKGLVKVNVATTSVSAATASWKKKGFTQFLAEPYFPHEKDEEQYLSLERTREGIQLLHNQSGGVDIESHGEQVKIYTIRSSADCSSVAKATNLPLAFLQNLVVVFDSCFFAFLEINPLVVRGSEVHLLDAAVLVDGAAASLVSGLWTEEDIVETKDTHSSEREVKELQKTTPASLKLTVLHPEGSLFFLLSGGGGSIVIADQAELRGVGHLIGNYGEYSGGPTREETHLYTRTVLELLLASPAKKKALIIAGGVANFTDIKATFAGVVDALTERASELRKASVRVYVRRGGPNEEVGLSYMETFLKKEHLFGSLHGSDAPITIAVDEAIDYVTSKK